MRVTFNLYTVGEHHLSRAFAQPLIQSDATLETFRHQLATHLVTLHGTPLVCGFVLNESTEAPWQAPMKRRLVAIIESFRIPITTFVLEQSSLPLALEVRDEIRCFVEESLVNVKRIKVVDDAANDFAIAWWIAQIFTNPRFLPHLTECRLDTPTPLDTAIIQRLFEVFVETSKDTLTVVSFHPPMDLPQHEVTRLATLLRQAHENIHFVRHAMSRTIGQHAFGVLLPLLPLKRFVIQISANPFSVAYETVTFTFDETLLANGGFSKEGVTLQGYVELRDTFDHAHVMLLR